jgi:hypothetical protein
MMDSVGCGQLQLANYLLETNFEDNMLKMMQTKTKALVRLYVIEGFDFS